jgi:hypothetical protein
VSKRNIPKLEEYTSYIKTIFQHDDSIGENSKTEPLPPTIVDSEEIAPIIEEPASLIEEPAPIIEEPTPIIEETAPIIEEIAPTFEEKAPILNNEEVVSTASKLSEDKVVEEPPIEQTV